MLAASRLGLLQDFLANLSELDVAEDLLVSAILCQRCHRCTELVLGDENASRQQAKQWHAGRHEVGTDRERLPGPTGSRCLRLLELNHLSLEVSLVVIFLLAEADDVQ